MIALLCQIGLSDADSVVSEDLDSESGSSKIILTPKKGKKRRKVVYFLWSLGGFFFNSHVRHVCLRREKHIFTIKFFSRVWQKNYLFPDKDLDSAKNRNLDRDRMNKNPVHDIDYGSVKLSRL
jgi:hypothetical protein